LKLQELFGPDDLVVGFEASDKWEAIDLLMRGLEERGCISSEHAARLRDEVIARERSMSTGMERGIAIPHAACNEIDDVVAVMGIVSSGEGLGFDSIDASPARFVVLLLIPRSKKLLHIRTLADVARVLGREEVREALLRAESGEEAWRALAAAEAETERA
jgi:mannitol/fructose-specific phosphotransferase system IIA component (Ntr-type)